MLLPLSPVLLDVLPRAPPTEAVVTLNLEALARLTGLPLSDGHNEDADEDEEKAPSALRARLLGTLVSDAPAWSLAAIQDLATGRARTVQEGDVIQGAEVLGIERGRILLREQGRHTYLDVGLEAATAVSTHLPRAAPPAGGSTPGGTGLAAPGAVWQAGGGDYAIDRRALQETLADLNSLARDARLMPAVRNGVAHGFQLQGVRRGSVYERLGIRSGDVVRRINGFDLDSPDKALEAYVRLRDASHIELELERSGARIRQRYTID